MKTLAALLLALAYKIDPTLKPAPNVTPQSGGGPGPVNPSKLK